MEKNFKINSAILLFSHSQKRAKTGESGTTEIHFRKRGNLHHRPTKKVSESMHKIVASLHCKCDCVSDGSYANRAEFQLSARNSRHHSLRMKFNSAVTSAAAKVTGGRKVVPLLRIQNSEILSRAQKETEAKWGKPVGNGIFLSPRANLKFHFCLRINNTPSNFSSVQLARPKIYLSIIQRIAGIPKSC